LDETYISTCRNDLCSKKDTCRRYHDKIGTVIKFKNLCRVDNNFKYYIYYLDGLVTSEEIKEEDNT